MSLVGNNSVQWLTLPKGKQRITNDSVISIECIIGWLIGNKEQPLQEIGQNVNSQILMHYLLLNDS